MHYHVESALLYKLYSRNSTIAIKLIAANAPFAIWQFTNHPTFWMNLSVFLRHVTIIDRSVIMSLEEDSN